MTVIIAVAGEDADRELVKPFRVRDRGDAAVGEHGRQYGVGEHGDLRTGRADHRRPEHDEEIAHPWPVWLAQPLEDADASRRPHQETQFERARDSHAPARRIAGVRKQIGDRERRHHGEVHEVRREGRQGESAMGVERAHVQREERHEQEIGEGDAREIDGEREFLRPVVEAGRQQPDELRREDPDQKQDDDLRSEQQRIDLAGEFLGRLASLLLQRLSVTGNEGGVEGALAEDGAETVRQALGDEKGVRNETRAHHGRLHGERKEAGDAREKREAADRKEIANHS